MTRLNRRDAIVYLHERHRAIVDEPSANVDHEELHADMMWLQMDLCERIRRRAQRRVRSIFKSVSYLWQMGDEEVRNAILQDFFMPHLAFQRDIAWARSHMDAPLAKAYEIVDEAKREARR